MKRGAHEMPLRGKLNLYLFVGVLIAVGAVFGALVVNALSLEQQQTLSDELGAYLGGTASGAMAPIDVFRERLFFHLKWLGLLWLLGISVVGSPFVLALDFLKGVLIGFAVGLTVRHLAWKGVAVSFAVVAPQNLVVVPALAIASVSAIRFAYYVGRERLFLGRGRLLPPLASHTGTSAALFVVLGIAAMWEAFVVPHIVSGLSDWL
ncbi:stage II sporulation protein M [Cohnella sp. JJ-181]|uniref:stage II sporulation protein M n=1 Tax=Cohnella rhizoplanae TaxID=2974897 RepID=UPI00232F1E06|nr:stage II sporulation protein M [Cohnella sp. JJ-181]